MKQVTITQDFLFNEIYALFNARAKELSEDNQILPERIQEFSVALTDLVDELILKYIEGQKAYPGTDITDSSLHKAAREEVIDLFYYLTAMSLGAR